VSYDTSAWEPVIGIETHVELMTRSKMFCGCPVTFGAEPNTAVCPVCLGLPGALPVPNRAAIEGIVSIGTALSCRIADESLFYRKNYFYPDLPKNYQISQYTFPVCEAGRLEVDVDGKAVEVGITRVHMEEDTGKTTHVGGGSGRIHDAEHALLDFNRSGVPLVEIVTEPDIRSADEARAYGMELQRIVRTLGVSDARLEEGSMRFDVNVSVRPAGSDEFGIRTEVKNVNSLRSLHGAIEFEIRRQIGVLEGGGTVVQETRHWNEDIGATTSGRTKEESEDYRYFQEPDLLPLSVDDAWRRRAREGLPELPAARRRRYRALELAEATVAALVDQAALGQMLDAAITAGADAKRTANWLTGDVVAHLRRESVDLEATGLSADHLAELSAMVGDRELSATAAKEVLGAVLGGEGSPRDIAESRDLIQVSDVSAIEGEVAQVLAEHADAVAKIRDGDMKPIGFLVGQVMRATGGKADPKLVSDLIRAKAQE
jgi:aspartyl-tRNA(Asn)/glutamyl-tRNA(Gln) amidotransferase subunit B